MQANSPEAARAQANLSSMLYQLGDPNRSDELRIEAQRSAERFGVAQTNRWLRVDSIWLDYQRGHWDAALRGADEFLAGSKGGLGYWEPMCRIARGHIWLARSDASGAVQDADKALESARLAKDPQVLYLALAFRARALLQADRREAAAALARELVTSLRVGRLGITSEWLIDLAVVLESLGQGTELQDLAARTRTPTPWLQAAAAFARSEFQQAADLYARIGSLSDAAYTRLRAAQHLAAARQEPEARRQLERALAFYRQVRASAYLREGEALLTASA